MVSACFNRDDYGDQIKDGKMDGACTTHGKDKYVKILVGKPGRKRPLKDLGTRRRMILNES
jgi:hypothetical protein